MMSGILAAGLAQLATAKGESIGYHATSPTGPFGALTGFVLNIDRLPPLTQDPDHEQEIVLTTGHLKGPVTPLMVRGYYVKDNVSGTVFAVQSVKLDVQQSCLLESVQVATFTPDRKGAR
jgi:hypothetical protein